MLYQFCWNRICSQAKQKLLVQQLDFLEANLQGRISIFEQIYI